jgi:hypothetical protein
MEKLIKKLDKIQAEIAKEVVDAKSEDYKLAARRAISKAKGLLAECEYPIVEEVEEEISNTTIDEAGDLIADDSEE